MFKKLSLVLVCLLLFSVTPVMAQDACEGNFDCDLDVDGTDASVFKSDFGRSGFKNPCPACESTAQVPKTGQTVSYHTGDDGDLEKGVAWPNPRFTVLYHYWDAGLNINAPCNPTTVDCDGQPNNDMVLDNLTGLYWTRDSSYSGPYSWSYAVSEARTGGHWIGGYDDWRLPNVKELQSLIDFSQSGPALPSGHPFVEVQSDYYWSSTTHAYHTGDAWGVYMLNGLVDYLDKYYDGFYVWPVRGGE